METFFIQPKCLIKVSLEKQSGPFFFKMKIARDGTTATTHNSSKDNGKKTLEIRKPGVKKPIKFREPKKESIR